jgi:tRNA (guanine-N7-)-methyltransferase
MADLPVLDPTDLVITRKRKKYKFAHFDAYANCFEFNRGEEPKRLQKELHAYFGNDNPIILEIAAGNAQFSLELARRHADQNFIAIDIKSDRLYTSAKQALSDGVTNIAFVRMHLNELSKLFKPASVQTIWLTFPDPFPRDRSAKHRLSHPSFLAQYGKVLQQNGQLKFKTDNRQLFLWSLEQLVAQNWQLQELSFDLHESDLPDEYKIKTYYEERFTAQDIPTNYTTAHIPQNIE